MLRKHLQWTLQIKCYRLIIMTTTLFIIIMTTMIKKNKQISGLFTVEASEDVWGRALHWCPLQWEERSFSALVSWSPQWRRAVHQAAPPLSECDSGVSPTGAAWSSCQAPDCMDGPVQRPCWPWSPPQSGRWSGTPLWCAHGTAEGWSSPAALPPSPSSLQSESRRLITRINLV